MSAADETTTAAALDDETTMIKYLRDKITGRPAVFSRTGETPSNEVSSIKKTNSQNSLIDAMPVNNNVKSRETSIDRTSNQVDKLTAAGPIGPSSGRRPISSSSPIIIPKKPPRSNASSQSSSSYASVADHMASVGESSSRLHQESGDEASTNFLLPTLPSACQRLEHSAARDRISVKNIRRQPAKQRLSTLRETDDNASNTAGTEFDLFSSITAPLSSTPEDDSSAVAAPVVPRIESKSQQQPLIDLSDLDTARARLRMSLRPRDRSADNILLATNYNNNNNNNNNNSRIPVDSSLITPTFVSPVQRSVSFKRPQDINGTKSITRSGYQPIVMSKKDEDENIPVKSVVNPFNQFNSITSELGRHGTIDDRTSAIHVDHTNSSSIVDTHSMSRSSSQEHIYDNLDLFNRHKTTTTTLETTSSEDEPPPSNIVVKPREHAAAMTTRQRPLTMHVSTNSGSEKQKSNEFDNVFNQLKKRGSIRKIRVSDDLPPEETPPPPQSVPIEETTPFQPPENVSLTTKIVEPTTIAPQNRRKTVGGVHLQTNKVGTEDSTNKPAPSWIDIAKQKQSKFQSVSMVKNGGHNESEQVEPPKKQGTSTVVSSSRLSPPPPVARESAHPVDHRSNRKSMFEPVMTRRPSPSSTPPNSHGLERDSIRALKAGNPNRINNLIQFFDK